MGEIISVKEAARIAGVDGDTIRNWCDTGKLEHHRTAGNHRKIDRDHLDAVIKPGLPRHTAKVDPLLLFKTWANVAEDLADWEPAETSLFHRLAEARTDARTVITVLTEFVEKIDEEQDRRYL